ncbi:C-type lectin domain family 4 member M-like, partial [Astyanax mexicanus]
CPPGWKKFMSSCYYISINMQTWDQSRMDCRGKGADLVIINSEEEQEFIKRQGKGVWIGLTDAEEEGVWKWLRCILCFGPRFWMAGEPNSFARAEDCVFSKVGTFTLQTWLDMPCCAENIWICEATLSSS